MLNEYGSMCLIQSLERDAHGMSDGSLLKVQGSEHTGLTVHFNGTDQGISTVFQTETMPSHSGVTTCIRWHQNPEYCLAAVRDSVQLQHTGNNHGPTHLFRMLASSPDSTKYVTFMCIDSKMYLHCDKSGNPYMSSNCDRPAWFQVLQLEDEVDGGFASSTKESRYFGRIMYHCHDIAHTPICGDALNYYSRIGSTI